MSNPSDLKSRNQSLYDALKLFTTDALHVLGKAVTDGAAIPSFYEPAWIQEGDENSFVRRQVPKPEYGLLVNMLINTIESLASYQAAHSAIEADNLWSSHMNKLVGSAMNSHRIDIKVVLKKIPSRILADTRQFVLSVHHFDEQVNRFELMVNSPTIEYIRTTPLYGITLQNNISLSDQISFETLTDDKVITLLDLGLITSDSFGAGIDFANRPPRTAIVTKFFIPKTVRGDADNPEPLNNAVLELWNRSTIAETTAIELLILIQGTAITPIGSLTNALGATNGGSRLQRNAIANAWAIPSINLTAEAAQKFHQLWPIVSDSSKKSRHFLAIALRRFALAMSRPALDDKLIDLMICAEALFLPDGNAELTFRLAHRAALLLGDNPKHQKEIFDFFKAAYGKRSTIVHGNKSLLNDAKDIVDLNETITQLSEYLRKSILKMLEIALHPQAPNELINWTELMFPDTAAQETQRHEI
jgi:Apea-like HEPN